MTIEKLIEKTLNESTTTDIQVIDPKLVVICDH